MISPMGSRDRALAHMVIDSLDDDGYFKLSFDELAGLVPPEHDVRAEDFLAALRLVQSLDPAGVAARTLEECLELQLLPLPGSTPGRALRARHRARQAPAAARQPGMGAAAARRQLRRAHASHGTRADPHPRPQAGSPLRRSRGALRGARRAGEEGARALGGEHQSGLAAARAAEPRLRRGAPGPRRLQPVDVAPTRRRRAGCCARSSSASPPSSASPTRSSRASAASSSTAKWR